MMQIINQTSKSILRGAILVTAIMMVLLFSTAFAETPQLVNYSGRLTNNANEILTGSYDLTFSIYKVSQWGDTFWRETHNSVNVSEGLFNVMLGSINPLVDSVFQGSARYLGIAVGPDLEMTPRFRLASVPYTFRTASVDGAKGGDISSAVSIGSGHIVSGIECFVAGINNIATGDYATIGGGQYNTASGRFSVVCGGGATMDLDSNVAGADFAAVVGGIRNRAFGHSSFIGGGMGNYTYEQWTTVSGGVNNKAEAKYGTVPGGSGNTAGGEYSFAAGHRAKAMHPGSFVWADADTANFYSLRNNQFMTRAGGGNRFEVNNSQWIEIYDDGTNLINSSSGALLTTSGTWANASDKNLKENFESIDGRKLLNSLLDMPVARWNYKSEGSSVHHIGPTAQDFYQTFELGNNNKTISTIDPGGVALVAIQELTRQLKKEQKTVALLQARLKALEEKIK